ncbi:MAG: thioredoxin domain-containing protein [Oscillospiraceae bacterium]
MSNSLIKEKSPYLRQHAENPVDWLPWGLEAFYRADHEDKPIFLSIGYSTCHWCHVMAHESFEDSQVAELLNRYYIPVKVDREERPDVDSVYMKACVALTGSGGWPLTIIMTPDKLPFFAGTYIPKNSRGGQAGLIPLLSAIAAKWDRDRESLLQTAQEISSFVAREQPALRPSPERISLQPLPGSWPPPMTRSTAALAPPPVPRPMTCCFFCVFPISPETRNSGRWWTTA